MKLLHIDSSPRPGSHSRTLSQAFVDAYRATTPHTEVIRRDLVQTQPPFVDEAWVQNAFLPEDQRIPGALAISDELTDEFLESDVVVLGIPMYNFGPPANVKAWIDQVMRAGRTFQYTESGVKGLVTDKTVVVVLSRGGGYSPGAPAEAMNFQEPYIRALFGFIGFTDVHMIVLEDIYNGDLNYKLTERTIEATRLAREIALQRESVLEATPV